MNDALPLCQSALPGLTWSKVAPRALPPLAPPAVPLRTLHRAVKKAGRPVLIVNDADRPLPAALPDVVRELWELSGEKATVVIATGTHAGQAAFYRDRLGGLPVHCHDARDAAAHGELEVAGAPGVRLDRVVLEADLVVAFGSVEPHYFGGWSGAHKTATVGVMDRASIEHNHRGALAPACKVLALEGNPVFDGLARIAAALERGRDLLCVNHVLDPQDRPVSVAVGTWRGALERSLGPARAQFVHDLPAPVDVLVARVKGPLAKNLYQAEKGLKNNEHSVRDGGDIIIDAELPDGVGPDRFVKLLEEAPDLPTALRLVEERYVLGDHKAVKLRALEARGVRVRIASPRLAPQAVARAGLEVHPSLEAALAGVRADGRGGAGRGLVVDDAAVLTTRAGA